MAVWLSCHLYFVIACASCWTRTLFGGRSPIRRWRQIRARSSYSMFTTLVVCGPCVEKCLSASVVLTYLPLSETRIALVSVVAFLTRLRARGSAICRRIGHAKVCYLVCRRVARTAVLNIGTAIRSRLGSFAPMRPL